MKAPTRRNLRGFYFAGAFKNEIAGKLPLGHEQISTTNIYIHADMTLKENAIAKVAPPTATAAGRYQPSDSVMAFLEAL